MVTKTMTTEMGVCEWCHSATVDEPTDKEHRAYKHQGLDVQYLCRRCGALWSTGAREEMATTIKIKIEAEMEDGSIKEVTLAQAKAMIAAGTHYQDEGIRIWDISYLNAGETFSVVLIYIRDHCKRCERPDCDGCKIARKVQWYHQ